jgi:hypothetical protein
MRQLGIYVRNEPKYNTNPSQTDTIIIISDARCSTHQKADELSYSYHFAPAHLETKRFLVFPARRFLISTFHSPIYNLSGTGKAALRNEGTVPYVVTCMSDYRRGLDRRLDLSATFNTQLVTTLNYSDMANLRTSQITTAHAKYFQSLSLGHRRRKSLKWRRHVKIIENREIYNTSWKTSRPDDTTSRN